MAEQRLVRETFPTGPLQCNCTILADLEAREAMVIDPGDRGDVQRVLDFLAARGLKLTCIVITHAHIDHVGGAAALRRATGAPVVMDPRDLPLLEIMDWQAQFLGYRYVPETVPPDLSAAPGETLAAGNWRGEVLRTPGHTPGSFCVYFPDRELVLAGDTLFAGSIGRTDLPGGDSRAILRSIRDRLMVLPGKTVVVPGHGPETTMEQEAESNPFLTSLKM